jgi:uncharacterized membrane protein
MQLGLLAVLEVLVVTAVLQSFITRIKTGYQHIKEGSAYGNRER